MSKWQKQGFVAEFEEFASVERPARGYCTGVWTDSRYDTSGQADAQGAICSNAAAAWRTSVSAW